MATCCSRYLMCSLADFSALRRTMDAQNKVFAIAMATCYSRYLMCSLADFSALRRTMDAKLLFLTTFLVLVRSELINVANFEFWLLAKVFVNHSVQVPAIVLPSTPFRNYKDTTNIQINRMIYEYALTPETCVINGTEDVIVFGDTGNYLRIFKGNTPWPSCTKNSTHTCLGVVNATASVNDTYKLLPAQSVHSEFPLNGQTSPMNCYNETVHANTTISFRGYMPRGNSTFTLFNSDSILNATRLATVTFIWTTATTSTTTTTTTTTYTTMAPNVTEPVAPSPKPPTNEAGPEKQTTSSATSTSTTTSTTSTSTSTSTSTTSITTTPMPTTPPMPMPAVSVSMEITGNKTKTVAELTAASMQPNSTQTTSYAMTSEKVGADGITPETSLAMHLTTSNVQPLVNGTMPDATVTKALTRRIKRFVRRINGPSNMVRGSPPSILPEASTSIMNTTSGPINVRSFTFHTTQKNATRTTS